MAMGRPKSTLVLDSELREQLESLANSRSLPGGLVRRAKIILLSAAGKNDREIAPQLEASRNTVGLWRRRFLAQGCQDCTTSHAQAVPARLATNELPN